jgi:hypothetical protein
MFKLINTPTLLSLNISFVEESHFTKVTAKQTLLNKLQQVKNRNRAARNVA